MTLKRDNLVFRPKVSKPEAVLRRKTRQKSQTSDSF